MASEQALRSLDQELGPEPGPEIAWTPRRPPLQGGWGPGWEAPEAQHIAEGPLARALAERVARVVRQRLEDAVREELAEELRERLAERVRERVSSALRGTPLRDTQAIADRIAKELRARMHEQAAHGRIVEGLCTALAQAELHPGRVIERMNEAVRARVPQGLRHRLREELRDRVGYPIV